MHLSKIRGSNHPRAHSPLPHVLIVSEYFTPVMVHTVSEWLKSRILCKYTLIYKNIFT